MDGQDGASQPYVDPAVLQTLRCELEPDPDYCVVFVNSYIQQLPRRLDRLRHAVEAMDLDAAMDAVLSVKTSSQMVGAAYLGMLADELETILRHLGDPPGDPRRAAGVTPVGSFGKHGRLHGPDGGRALRRRSGLSPAP